MTPQPAPRLTTVMVVLAWAVLQHPDDPVIARRLARAILDASEHDDAQRPPEAA